MDEDMITLQEAAKEYRVGRRTLFEWMRSGELLTVKYHRDRYTYVHRADVVRLLAAHPAGRPGRPGGWLKPDGGDNP